jgi:hypothetical protein
MPTVIDPLAALAENKDWTGKAIFREDFNKLSPTPGYLRTKDTASTFSKGLAYWLNIASGGTDFKRGFLSPTPDQIDYLIGQATGGVGREAMKLEQAISATITGEDLPTYKIPLVGRFYGNSDGKSQEGNRFYTNLKEMNEHQAEIQGLARAGHGAEATAYMKDNPESRLFREADRTQMVVSRLQKYRRDMVEKNADREKITAIENQITQVMHGFNQRVKDAKAASVARVK